MTGQNWQERIRNGKWKRLYPLLDGQVPRWQYVEDTGEVLLSLIGDPRSGYEVWNRLRPQSDTCNNPGWLTVQGVFKYFNRLGIINRPHYREAAAQVGIA